MSDVAIKIENLSKQYRLGVVGTGTLSHDLKRWWTVNMRGKEDPYLKIGETNDRSTKASSEYVWALKDINLEIKKGDVVGIIGKNGAGKSTLLKILSKVTKPTTGTVQYKGRIASLLEVGTGFHMEMTGRENIYMNGSIMGMTRTEITRKLDEIIDFAGVERFIDTPVKRYSSGMTVRLGFAIAAHLEPEILVVDEVLAVGDAEFQKKAIGKMQDVSKGEGRTVLFVSHNMGAVEKLCNTGFLLNLGKINYSGDAASVIKRYISSDNTAPLYEARKNIKTPHIIKAFIADDKTNIKVDFLHSENIYINTLIEQSLISKNTYLFISILDSHKRKIFSAEREITYSEHILKLNNNQLTRGDYSLQIIIYQPAICQYEVLDDICSFHISDGGSNFSHLETFDYGVIFGNYSWIS